MRPTPIQPKRADFASFDDYFDAMIEYHLKLNAKIQEDLQTPVSFIQSFDQARPNVRELASVGRTCRGASPLPQMKQAWIERLQQFVQLHIQ